jgi:cobalt-zinc-cadmium efflux system membrane fusion protein
MGQERQQSASSRRALAWCAAGVAVVAIAALWFYPGLKAPAVAAPVPAAAPPSGPPTVTLTDAQENSIRVAAIQERAFEVEREAVGSIDVNENLAVQVYTPYQGRIIEAGPNLGDDVTRGQVLFTVESADFIAAQSGLIGAAATHDQAASALERARRLYADKAIDQNDYETAVANEQTAAGALRAARAAMAVFGRTGSETDRLIATRSVERALVVRSPVSGRITARAAAPGLQVQPGSAPAPYAVADLSTVWLVASVGETDSPLVRPGQQITATVPAWPGRQFRGTLSALGTIVDPNTHRVTVHAVLHDPQHELRPGMLADVTLRLADPVTAPAVPMSGVVREGDGTLSVWVTTDRHHYQQRIVHVGIQQDGYDQILDGVKPGELVAIDGAIFLSNMAFGGAS